MIRTEQPSRGMRHNWHIASKRIQCWADAVDAMVFHLGDIAVLACDEHDARQVITEEDCSTELKEVRREIRSLKDKMKEAPHGA